MTDNKIIKALEESELFLQNRVKDGQPINLNEYDVERLRNISQVCAKAYNEINRLQTENKNSKVENQSLRSAANSLKMHYEEAQAEIDSLKIFRGYAKKRASDYRTMRDKYLNAKSEAVKEFAEKLKELDGYDNHTFDDCVSLLVSEEYKKGRYEKTNEIWSTIDNLVKENGGENND